MSARRAQRGQTTAEYTGIVALVGLIVVAVILFGTPLGKKAGEYAEYAVCRITEAFGGGGGCEAPRSAEDRIPPGPCTVSTAGGGVNVGASVSWLTLEGGTTVMIEAYSDGSYDLTVVDSAGIGAGEDIGAEVSVTIDGQTYSAGAYASAQAILAGEHGVTYHADDEGELKDILVAVGGDQVAESLGVNDPTGITEWVTGNVIDWFTGETPDPSEQFIAGGIEGSLSGVLGTWGTGGGASLETSTYLGATQSDEGYTLYYSNEVSGNAYGQLLPAGVDVSASGSYEGLMEVNFDSEGNPVSVGLTTTVGYGTDPDALNSIEVYSEVPLGDDAAQNAELIALATGSASGGVVGALTIDDFLAMAQEDGHISVNHYTVDPNSYGLGGNIGIDPIQVGAGIDAEFPTSSLESSQYWNGAEFVDNPNCGL